MLIVNTLLVLNLGHSPLYRHFCKCLVSTQPLPPPYIKGAGEPLIIFVLTFVYLNLPCDSTGEKLFVVLLTLYKSAEYISEILLHIETYIFACLNERMVFQVLLLFNRLFKSSRSLIVLSYAL